MARFNLVERRVAKFLREPPSVRQAAGVIVTVTGAVVVGAGLLMTLVDNKEYPNLGLGLWWALQTVTTVGYGDVAPREFGGRLVAAVVMLEGIAFIAIITALITSTFVARAAREHEKELAEGELSDLQLIERRFDELERKLDAIAAARSPEST
jgi:voltage-gated potassium channel Kch